MPKMRTSDNPEIQALLTEGALLAKEQQRISDAMDEVWTDGEAMRPLILQLDAAVTRAAEIVKAEVALREELGLPIEIDQRIAGLACIESAKRLAEMHVGMLAAIDGGYWPLRSPPTGVMTN